MVGLRTLRFTRALAIMTLVCTAGACSKILDLEKLSEKTGIDAGVHDAHASPSECATDTIDAAARPDLRAAGDETRYFALNRIDLAISPSLGFDLDHVATIDPASSSCVFPREGEHVIDTAGGVDNAVAELLPTVALAAPALSNQGVNDRLHGGHFGLVLGIGGWNGSSTDESLTVLVFPALGIWSVNPDGSMVPGGPSNTDRREIVGDGARTDRWMRDARFSSTGIASRSAAAWVNDGKLVARFDTLIIPIRSDLDLKLIDFVLEDAWITAELAPGSRAAGGATLRDGLFAGRLVASQFLAQLLVLRTGPEYLCHQQGLPELAASTVCGFRDIRSSHCEDGRALPCDALSAGARFETYEVEQLGPSFEQNVELYERAGILVPEQRCLDVDLDAGVRCPQ